MEELQKEFVPYELAVKLKALGFDKPCLLHVNHYGEMKETRSSLWMFNGYLAEGDDDEKITIDYEFPAYPSNKEEYWQEINIPTFSQAFRWFREKNFYVSINTYHSVNEDKPFGLSIDYLHESGKWDYLDYRGEIDFKTYEEAELACLTKLIEISESKSE